MDEINQWQEDEALEQLIAVNRTKAELLANWESPSEVYWSCALAYYEAALAYYCITDRDESELFNNMALGLINKGWV